MMVVEQIPVIGPTELKPLLVTVATAGTAALVGYVVKRCRVPKSSRVVSDIAQVVSDNAINAEKSFGGLKQSQINEIVSNTYRGVKAVIDGDTLEYWFRSASGKMDATCTFLQYSGAANSPRFFIEKLIAAMKANGDYSSI